MPTFVHGRNGFVSITDSSAVVQDISTYCNTVSWPRSIETAETTSFGPSVPSKTYIAGLQDSTVSMGGSWEPTLDGIMAGLIGLAAGTLIVHGPAGNASGKVKYSLVAPVFAILTAYSVSTPVGDLVSWTASFQVSGVPTRGTF
jgi:hypothetical protein